MAILIRQAQLFTEDDRVRLTAAGSIVHFNKGGQIYQQGTSAGAAFNIISGVVKAYRTGADGSEHIVAFLFPEDVFGLAEGARYTNSTTALTPVTAFQIAVPALRSKLTRDAALDFHVICKLCQELRDAQQHSLLLARRQAVPKLAAFLEMLEQHQSARGGGDIYLPMNRWRIRRPVPRSGEPGIPHINRARRPPAPDDSRPRRIALDLRLTGVAPDDSFR